MARRRPFAGTSLVAILVAAPALAENIIPAGPEFQVSRGHASYYATMDGYAMSPAISRAPNGEFVVVWEEIAGNYVNDNSNYQYRVAARRFNRDGTGAGQQFTVFQQPKDGPHIGGYNRWFKPDVAADVNSGFVVVWSNYHDDWQAEFGRVWAQQFNANNDPQGAKIQVNTAEALTNYDIGQNSVATAPDGGFLVVWQPLVASDVNARRFSASGTPLGPEFAVNDQPVGWGQPAVDSNAQGDFVVSWGEYNAPYIGTFAQRIDVDGNQIGSDLAVNDHGDTWKNAVAVAPDGSSMVLGFVYGYAQPERDLTARIYDPAGAPVTGDFDINGDAEESAVDADPDGNFVVTWRDYDWNVHAQRFSPAGVALESDFAVSEGFSYSGGLYVFDQFPDVATDAAGDFVVVWSDNFYGDYGPNGEYVFNYGITARRFAVCGNARIGLEDECDDGNTTALDGCSASCRVETCHACSGDPSLCEQFTGCTAACTDPVPIQPNTTALGFKGIGAPVGDEGMTFKGKIANPPLTHLEWDPSSDGIELALTTTGLVYGIFGTTALPPGPPGGGCDPARDGWKTKPGSYVYKNVSNALPPGCAPGSANGVRVVKVKDNLDRDGTIQFRVKARNASIALVPVPPLTATVILGTSPGAGAAGRCGQITFTGAIGTRFFP